MKRRIAMILTLILTTGTLLAGCGKSAGASGDSDVAYIQDKGTLIVGITDFAPMDYKDDAGNWIGFDADMARIVAEKLGVEARNEST